MLKTPFRQFRYLGWRVIIKPLRTYKCNVAWDCVQGSFPALHNSVTYCSKGTETLLCMAQSLGWFMWRGCPAGMMYERISSPDELLVLQGLWCIWSRFAACPVTVSVPSGDKLEMAGSEIFKNVLTSQLNHRHMIWLTLFQGGFLGFFSSWVDAESCCHLGPSAPLASGDGGF